MNYERAKIFLKENIKVHLTLKRLIPNTDKNIYFNGQLKKVEKDYLILKDFKDGEIRIFYFDIEKPIEEFKSLDDNLK
jgi:hypothetical protein